MQDFFLIPIMDIDPMWSVRGFSHDYYAQEYCKEILNIPSEFIEEAYLCKQGLEIRLTGFEELIEEDWCIQLMRISSQIN